MLSWDCQNQVVRAADFLSGSSSTLLATLFGATHEKSHFLRVGLIKVLSHIQIVDFGYRNADFTPISLLWNTIEKRNRHVIIMRTYYNSFPRTKSSSFHYNSIQNLAAPYNHTTQKSSTEFSAILYAFRLSVYIWRNEKSKWNEACTMFLCQYIQGDFFNWASPEFAKYWPVSDWFQKNV